MYNHMVLKQLAHPSTNLWYAKVSDGHGSIISFDEFAEKVTLPSLEGDDIFSASHSGAYAIHLAKWFDLFDRNQLLILSYSELSRDPSRLQRRVEAFLGRTIRGDFHRKNELKSKVKVSMQSCSVSDTLGPIFRGLNQDLYTLLDSNPGPPMEERSFPKFESPDCYEDTLPQ